MARFRWINMWTARNSFFLQGILGHKDYAGQNTTEVYKIWAWSSKEPTVQYTVKTHAHQCDMHIARCNIHIALVRTCTLVQYWSHATDKAAVSSLVRLSSFGGVSSWKSNAVLLEAVCERSQCPLKSNSGNVIIYVYQYLPVHKNGTS